MTFGVAAALALSGVVGLSLGLVGGGGSILTVPILVYVAGVPVGQAVPLSLAIVGATAAAGAALQYRQGLVHLRAAWIFAAMGMAGAVFGARLTPLVPPPVLMTLFALLMLAVGGRMLLTADGGEAPARAECSPPKCALSGLGLGVLTGFLGVGGGFLIVPALLRYAKLPMKQAAGTSLLIIAANSAAGFLSHLSETGGSSVLAAAFTGSALLGLLAGVALARRTRPEGLKSAFGGLSLAVALYLFVMNFTPLMKVITHE